MLTLGIWTIQRECPSPRFSPSSIYVSQSNNKFLFLQALPTFLIKTGTATLLPKSFCHSVTVFNKTLLPVFPIFPNCFICLHILFFPIHSGDVSHIGSFSRLLQSKKWCFERQTYTTFFWNTYYLPTSPSKPQPYWLWIKIIFEVINLHWRADGRILHVL